MMVSYTRARAEGLGVELPGGVMQRAERIVVVAGGTLIAAWFGIATASAATILGVTMLVCGIASIATALGRWIPATASSLLARPRPPPGPARRSRWHRRRSARSSITSG